MNIKELERKFNQTNAYKNMKQMLDKKKEYMCLFNSDTMESSQFINPDLPKDLFQVLKKIEFQSKFLLYLFFFLQIIILSCLNCLLLLYYLTLYII